MSLIDLPPELWRKILILLHEPKLDKGIHDKAYFYESALNALVSCHPKGQLRHIDPFRLSPLLLVNKRCYTLTMTYLWNTFIITMPFNQDRNETYRMGTFHEKSVFTQNFNNDILMIDSTRFYSSPLFFVTHYYVNNSKISLEIVDQPNTLLNALELANPRYLPNLETFSADLMVKFPMDIGLAFTGTTDYPQQLSIVLTIDLHYLFELANSPAQAALRLITSLVFYFSKKPVKCSKSQCVGLTPELHSFDLINQMSTLEELTLIGHTTSQKYIDSLLSCKPNLKVLNIGYLTLNAQIKYNNIGQNVTELCCLYSGFGFILSQKLLFPQVKKLSLNYDHLNWALDTSHESFTNLEEFVCNFTMENFNYQVFCMCVYILESNQRLKHFSITHFDSVCWNKAKDTMSFPSVTSVRVDNSLFRKYSGIIHSFFKIFPLCEYIEIKSHLGPPIYYKELKQFALNNPRSRYIIISNSGDISYFINLSHIVLGFREKGFLLTDFCFPSLPEPNYPMLGSCRRKKERSILESEKQSWPCVIDLQRLRNKIHESSRFSEDSTSLTGTFMDLNIA